MIEKLTTHLTLLTRLTCHLYAPFKVQKPILHLSDKELVLLILYVFVSLTISM